MMNILRHHHDQNFDPQTSSLLGVDVCMHAGFGPVHISQSAASLVVYLAGGAPMVFATATSAPCTSIFKPIWLDTASSLSLVPVPSSQADSASLYWSHERLHRATLLNYPKRIQTYQQDRDDLEQQFVQGALNLSQASAKDRADFSAQCFNLAAQAEADWLLRVEQAPAQRKILHSHAWRQFNKKAGFQ